MKAKEIRIVTVARSRLSLQENRFYDMIVGEIGLVRNLVWIAREGLIDLMGI